MALCISSAITFFLQLYIVACKPKWVHEVESCPMANNLTDWIRASDTLGCIHSSTSKDSSEQLHVYHCVPSSFMNETVEFCGKSVPVEEGNCPVYTYAFGDNISPNAKSCKNFSTGCPKELYFSKMAYLYSECFNVNKRCRCYRADSTCAEDCRETDIDLSYRSTKEITEPSTPRPDSESGKTDIIVVLTVGFLLIALVAMAILFKVYRKKQKMSTRYERTRRVSYNANDEDVRLERDDGTDHFSLHELLCSIGKRLKEGSIEKFSCHLNAEKKNTEHQRINGLSSGSDILLRMHEIYDFNLNFFLLEAFLERAKEEALKRRCIEFAKNHNKIYYTKGNACERGYRELILHLNRSIDEFSDGEIDKMRKQLSDIMQMKDPGDILLKEISEGSVLVHFLIKKKYLTRARVCNFSILKKYGLQEITLMGKRIYPEENRDEPLDHPNSTLLEQEKRKTMIYVSEVSFEFGPKELTAHKRVAEEMQIIWELIGEQKSPDDSVFIIHCTEKDREETCLALFESAANVINVNELKTLNKVMNSNRIIICCIGEHPIYEAYLHFLQDLNTSENLFVYTIEKEHGRVEQRVLDIISSFGEKVKKDHILHSNADKHELYRSYCHYVEKELAELFHTMTCKIDNKDTNVIDVVTMNLRKLVFLKRILKFDNDTGKPLSNECLELPKRTKDDAVGYIVDGDTLILSKKETGRWSKGFSQNQEKICEKLIGVNVNIKIMQALVSGSKIHCSNRKLIGSVGMFANINENGKMVQVCISSGQIVQKYEIAYFDNDGENFELGYCIWPDKEKLRLDLFSCISVIKLHEHVKTLIQRRFDQPIKLYRGALKELEHRKVFKYGASSYLTFGYLRGAIHTALFGNSQMVFVEPLLGSFSCPGDSGAVVLTKMKEEYVALGIVIGGSLEICEDSEESEYKDYSPNSTIAVMLSESMDQFQSCHTEIDIVDFFM